MTESVAGAQPRSRGLAGKVAVVAGGGSGIGAAAATRLASEGCLVVVGDVDGVAAQRIADQITGCGASAQAVAFDLADPESVAALIAAATDAYGGVDALFNVGSDMRLVAADTDVVDIDLGVWDRTMSVTLRGYLLSMRYAIPSMVRRGGGAIVNMSSAAAFLGESSRPAYATAKAGVCALTRHVASRWGTHGVRCNAVAPGFTATETIRSAPHWSELQAGALRQMRSQRVGTPDDVASLVTYLISDEAEWVNGQVINIDGGTVLR